MVDPRIAIEVLEERALLTASVSLVALSDSTPVPGTDGEVLFTEVTDAVQSGDGIAFRTRDENSDFGIYVSTGGALTPIVDSDTAPDPRTLGSRFHTAGFPQSIQGGVVTFRATPNGLRNPGLFQGSGGELPSRGIVNLVTGLDVLPGGFGTPGSVHRSQTRGATTVIDVSDGDGGEGLFLATGDGLTFIADTDSMIPGTENPVTRIDSPVTDGVNIAFIAGRFTTHPAVVMGQVGVPFENWTIAAAVSPHDISLSGGALAVGGNHLHRYRVNAAPELVVDGTDLIPDGTRQYAGITVRSSFGSTVAFTEAGTLHVATSSDVRTIIATGDVVAGREIASFDVTPDALHGNTIVFAAEHTDGSTAIYTANFAITEEPLGVPVMTGPIRFPKSYDPQPLFTWTEVERATYDLRVTRLDGAGGLVETGIEQTQFVPTHLEPGEYVVSVRAVRGEEVSDWSARRQFRVVWPSPGKVTIVSPRAWDELTSETIKLKLRKPEHATTIRVVVATEDFDGLVDVGGGAKYIITHDQNGVPIADLPVGAEVEAEVGNHPFATRRVRILLGAFNGPSTGGSREPAEVRFFRLSAGALGPLTSVDVAVDNSPIRLTSPQQNEVVDPWSTFEWVSTIDETLYRLSIWELPNSSRPLTTIETTNTSQHVFLRPGRYMAAVRDARESGTRTVSDSVYFEVTADPLSLAPALPDDGATNQDSSGAVTNNASPTFSFQEGVANFLEEAGGGNRRIQQSATPPQLTVDLRIDRLDPGEERTLRYDGITTTAFTIPTALEPGRYRARTRVVTVDGPVNSWGEALKFKVDPDLVPTAMITTSEERTLDRTPEFEWSNVVGADSYNLQLIDRVSGEQVFRKTGLTGSSWTPPRNIRPGYYGVQVRAKGPTGSAAWSERHHLDILNYRDSRPTVLGPAGRIAVSAPVVTFTEIAAASEYEIRVKNVSTGQDDVVRMRGITGDSYTLPSLPDGRYRAWVRSYDDKGRHGPWGDPTDFRIDSTLVGRSGIQTPTRGETVYDSRPTLGWFDVENAATWELEIDNRTTGEKQAVYETGLTELTWTSSQPLPTGTYEARVRAIGAAGRVGDWSPRLRFKVDDTRLATPLVAFIVDTDGGLPQIDWSATPATDRYKLEIDNLTTGVERVIQENRLTETSYVPPDPLPAGRYRVRVRSLADSGLRSPWSEERLFEVD